MFASRQTDSPQIATPQKSAGGPRLLAEGLIGRGPALMTSAPSDGLVCIIDDEAAVRCALGSLFRSHALAVALFDTPADFLTHALLDQPSCLVLDVQLNGLSGMDFQRELAVRGVTIPIVLMTGHGDIAMSVRGMKAGAVDFLAKPFAEEDILAAVMAALEVDRQRRTAAAEENRLRDLYESLSPREREIMGLVTAGLMNKQVAGRLALSEITVKIHRGNVMRKMNAQSLADLVRMAEALHVRDRSAARFSKAV